MFGMHRAAKASQCDRLRVHRGELRNQWHILKRAWRHYQKSPDPRLALVLLGADDVRQKKLRHADYDARDRDKLTSALDRLGA